MPFLYTKLIEDVIANRPAAGDKGRRFTSTDTGIEYYDNGTSWDAITINAAQITSGTLPAARLPNPSASTLGGVESIAAVTHQFLTGISTSGVPSQAQPTDANLSLSDITTNNVSTTKHGFAPKAPSDATKFLDGTGAYSTPAGGVPTSRSISTTAPLTGGGDLSANRTLAISNFVGDSGSGGSAGAVPAPGAGDAAAGRFLKADGTFAVPSGTASGTVTTVSATVPSDFSVSVTNPTTTPAIVITGGATKSAIQQQAYTYAADSGSANAYAVTLSPAPTIVTGSRVVFKAANANTTASTLAVNGGSATALKKNGSTALASGDIAVGQIVEAAYDGTNYQIIGGPGVASGSASTVVPAAPYVLVNGTAYVAATMFPAVLPDFTGYSYAQGTTTNVTGTNGSVNVRNVSSSVVAHYLKTASTSIEAEFLLASNITTGTGAVAYYQGGIQLWDSTNNQLYALQAGTYSGESGEGNNNSPIVIFQKIAYNGSTFSGVIVNLMYGGSLTGPLFHFKMSVSGGTLTSQYSMDGGQTWEAMATQSVGTISKAGITAFSNSSMTMLSLATV